MGPVWIVLADTHHARIYAQAARGAPLQLIDELEHEPAAKDASELMTDKPGRRSEANRGGAFATGPAMSAVKGSTVPHTDPEEVELHRFCRMLAERLDAGRAQHRFAELVLFMAPKALGHVRKTIDEKTRARIVHASAENIMPLDRSALAAKLGRDWFVPEQPFAG